MPTWNLGAMAPGSPGAANLKDHNGTVGFVGCNEGSEVSSEAAEWICVGRFHNRFLERKFRFAEVFDPVYEREAVSRWLL